MASTVYILGAGINKVIKGKHRLEPPLIGDFFVQALQHPTITKPMYKRKLDNLFKYIDRYWKMSEEDLKSAPFDLEVCFSLIQSQKADARQGNDSKKLGELSDIERRLTSVLAEFLSDEFKYAAIHSEELKKFGKLILKEHATVMTFNYDTIMESALEEASGERQPVPSTIGSSEPLGKVNISDEEVAFSKYKWNRPLAYGVQFDEVLLHQDRVPAFVSGKRFYSHPSNDLYRNPFLKLHGSLNWFALSRRTSQSPGTGDDSKALHSTQLAKPRWWYNRPYPDHPDRPACEIEPMIITPVLNKNLTTGVFYDIWQRAKTELTECRKLVIGGYSFPPTDFATRKLFIETFADNSLDELIIINPDTSVVQLAKKLCHYHKPVLVCRDLKEFLATVDHS